MFNSHARWDRKLPNQPPELNDPVEVNTTFSAGKIKPEYFIWHGRQYRVKEVTYRWQESKEFERVFCFSVHDGVNLYQLNLNNKFMTWRLVKVCAL